MEIRLLLVDDHAAMRDMIRALLRNQLSVTIVGEASTVADAFTLMEREHPDVVLLDVLMQGMDGGAIIQRLKHIDSHVKVIMLAVYLYQRDIEKMLRAGADGYLARDCDSAMLCEALRTVLQHRIFLCPQIDPAIQDRLLPIVEQLYAKRK